MNVFQQEIYEILELVYSNGENFIETYSFKIAFYEPKKKNKFQSNWRETIVKNLYEKFIQRLEVIIFDKLKERRCSLLNLQLNKLRSLYMEIITILDLDEKYSITYDNEKILCSVVEKTKL